MTGEIGHDWFFIIVGVFIIPLLKTNYWDNPHCQK